MARESPSRPSDTAPNGRPHPSDIGPFASVTHGLAHDVPDPQELRLEMGDHDMALNAEVDKYHVYVLHLKNVHQDTFNEAKTIVDHLLYQIELPSSSDDSRGTVFKMFDRVYTDMETPIAYVIGKVDDFQEEMCDIHYSDSPYPKKASGGIQKEDYDPVRELISASNDLVNCVKKIRLKSTSYHTDDRPKMDEFIVNNATDSESHGHLTDYTGEQGRERDLGFKWDTASYPDDIQRSLSKQPTYHVHFKEGKGWRHGMSEGTVPL